MQHMSRIRVVLLFKYDDLISLCVYEEFRVGWMQGSQNDKRADKTVLGAFCAYRLNPCWAGHNHDLVKRLDACKVS